MRGLSIALAVSLPFAASGCANFTHYTRALDLEDNS